MSRNKGPDSAGDRGRETGGDRTVDGLISFLRREGAARLAHRGDRTLLDHLIGTYEIVRRWNQPARLQHAALIHSVYGTEAYDRRLLALSRRAEVSQVAGDQAERLAYLFCVTPRDLLFAGTYAWTPGLPSRAGGEQEIDERSSATRAELDCLVLLHMANLAEQSCAEDRSPGRWLVRVRELAELLIDSHAVTLPLFVAELAAFSEADESLSARTYRAGIARADDLDARFNRLALAAATCPVVAEPCVWLAHLSRVRGDLPAARWWTRCAERRLLGLGTAWDKRLTFDQWRALAGLLEQSPHWELSASAGAISDPRGLFDAAPHGQAGDAGQDSRSGAPSVTEAGMTPPNAAAATKRFHRYIETFAERDGPAVRGIYPDLDGPPWYDPADFPLAGYLESHYEAIRAEILALGPSRFHRESERIGRSGEWDVAFFYERGRRRDQVCDACPVTTRGIECYPAMRSVAGLIYASRMRAGTHIRAHRGPTNLRVRCHLGIQVPSGDCAIRVADETRRWVEGRCLVFDDHFEHEAWNHGREDRIVLIIDMWHPGLSATEVRLLEGLHSYVYAHARRLNRYWSANAAAASHRRESETGRSGPG